MLISSTGWSNPPVLWCLQISWRQNLDPYPASLQVPLPTGGAFPRFPNLQCQDQGAEGLQAHCSLGVQHHCG